MEAKFEYVVKVGGKDVWHGLNQEKNLMKSWQKILKGVFQ